VDEDIFVGAIHESPLPPPQDSLTEDALPIHNYGDLMRIGLLADTHIPEAREALPVEVINAFQGVDLILHAGDIYILSVLDDLECIAPVLAASGDDDYGVTLADKRVKRIHMMELEGQTLWLGHERYFLQSHLMQNKSRQEQGDRGNPNIVVFGHEHRPTTEHIGDILYVNPGSPTYLDYRRGLGTVGILTIGSGRADVRILSL
jgi:putative phosphoesterase